MKRKIQVEVTGIHSRIGEPTEKIITSSDGYQEIMDDGSQIIEYQEQQDEHGPKVPTKVILSADGGSMEIVRNGDMSSKLVFGQDCEYDTEYLTPYGTMHLKVKTHDFDLAHVMEGPDIKVVAEYILEIEGQVQSNSMIVLETKKAEM